MNLVRKWLLLLSIISMPLLAENPAPAPDFSPPKDLSGPPFPPEDIIEKPSPETDRFLTEFISTMATLGLIISLILFIGWFLKRMVNTRMEQAYSTSGIKITERRMISPKTAVYQIEVGGRSIIMAETATGVTRLADFPKDEEPSNPPETNPPSTFSRLLDTQK